MIKIIMFRHGLTDYNIKGLMPGQIDVPLNITGLGQALNLAEQLKDEKIDLLLSSDLSRANQTARQVIRKNKYDFPIILSKYLRETSCGVADGKDFTLMKSTYPEYFKAKEDLTDNQTFDIKLPKGESHREVINRVLTCLEENFNNYPNVKTIVISTHGDVMRAINKYVYNQVKTFSNCEVLTMQYSLSEAKLMPL